MQRREWRDSERRITIYSNSIDAAGNIEKLLSTNSFTAPIAAILQRRTCEPIAGGYTASQMEEQVNGLIPNPAIKQTMSKSISCPSRTDLTHILLRQVETRAGNLTFAVQSIIRVSNVVIEVKRKSEQWLSTQSKSFKSDEPPTNSESNPDLSHSRHQKLPWSKIDGHKTLRPVNNRFQRELNYYTHHLADESLKYLDHFTKRVADWAELLQGRIKTYILGSFEPVSILRFLATFTFACHTNGIRESPALGPFHFFTKVNALPFWILAKNYRLSHLDKEKRKHYTIIVKWSTFSWKDMPHTMFQTKLAPRSSDLHSRWKWRQQIMGTLHSTGQCFAIAVMMNSSLTECAWRHQRAPRIGSTQHDLIL